MRLHRPRSTLFISGVFFFPFCPSYDCASCVLISGIVGVVRGCGERDIYVSSPWYYPPRMQIMCRVN
jgi:hypothetical protein